ncbi:MAG: CcmD family protein [Candidatus Kapaibacterium sp.]|nr:CcmD family protein [Bacteroidota bacterium]
MYLFFVQNALYVVLVVALIIWAGISWYITRLDKKVEMLEQKVLSIQQDVK